MYTIASTVLDTVCKEPDTGTGSMDTNVPLGIAPSTWASVPAAAIGV